MNITKRAFKFDLNHIPYDYAVEVMNRFNGLDLINRVPEELWTEVHNIVQEAKTKTIPRKRKNENQKSAHLRKIYKLLRKEEKQKTSRGAPGKSGLHASGEGERVTAPEPW